MGVGGSVACLRYLWIMKKLERSSQQLFHLHIALPLTWFICFLHPPQHPCVLPYHITALTGLTHVTGSALHHADTVNARFSFSLPCVKPQASTLFLPPSHQKFLVAFFCICKIIQRENWFLLDIDFSQACKPIKVHTLLLLQLYYLFHCHIVWLQHLSIIRLPCILNQFWNRPSAVLNLILAHHWQPDFKQKVLHSAPLCHSFSVPVLATLSV